MTRQYRTGARRIVLSLAAVLGVALFATLGAWQQSRGAAKQALLDAQDRALDGGRMQVLQTAVTQDLQGVHRVGGHASFVPPLLLLDGQSRHGRIGLRAYAVARATVSKGVLVDLGWLPMPADRRLPDVRVPVPATVDINGLWSPWPGQGLRAADNPWPKDAPAVLLTYLDRAEIERATGVPLASQVLRLDPRVPIGYQRDHDLLPNTLPPERHYGYAVQWYALAAAVAITWLLLLRRSLRKDSTA